jgi:hypothetical protein
VFKFLLGTSTQNNLVDTKLFFRAILKSLKKSGDNNYLAITHFWGICFPNKTHVAFHEFETTFVKFFSSYMDNEQI